MHRTREATITIADLIDVTKAPPANRLSLFSAYEDNLSIEMMIDQAKSELKNLLDFLYIAFASAFEGHEALNIYNHLVEKIKEIIAKSISSPFSVEEIEKKFDQYKFSSPHANFDFDKQLQVIISHTQIKDRKKQMLDAFIDICKKITIQLSLLQQLDLQDFLLATKKEHLIKIKSVTIDVQKKLNSDFKFLNSDFADILDAATTCTPENAENISVKVEQFQQALNALYQFNTVIDDQDKNITVSETGLVADSIAHLEKIISNLNQILFVKKEFLAIIASYLDTNSVSSLTKISAAHKALQKALGVAQEMVGQQYSAWRTLTPPKQWLDVNEALDEINKKTTLVIKNIIDEYYVLLNLIKIDDADTNSELLDQKYNTLAMASLELKENLNRELDQLISVKKGIIKRHQALNIAKNSIISALKTKQPTVQNTNVSGKRNRSLTCASSFFPLRPLPEAQSDSPEKEEKISESLLSNVLCHEYRRFIQCDDYWISQHLHMLRSLQQAVSSIPFLNRIKISEKNKNGLAKVGEHIGLMRNFLKDHPYKKEEAVKEAMLAQFDGLAIEAEKAGKLFTSMFSGRSSSATTFYDRLQNLDLQNPKTELFWLFYFIETRKNLLAKLEEKGQTINDYFKDTPEYFLPEYAEYRRDRIKAEKEDHIKSHESKEYARAITLG